MQLEHEQKILRYFTETDTQMQKKVHKEMFNIINH